MARRRGRGQLFCGPERLLRRRPDLRRARGLGGPTQALGKLESSKVSPVSFCLFSQKSERSACVLVHLQHAGAVPSEPSSCPPLPSPPRPHFSRLLNPGDCAPQVGEGSEAPYFQGRRRGPVTGQASTEACRGLPASVFAVEARNAPGRLSFCASREGRTHATTRATKNMRARLLSQRFEQRGPGRPEVNWKLQSSARVGSDSGGS